MLPRPAPRLPLCLALLAGLAACRGGSSSTALEVSPTALDFGYVIGSSTTRLELHVANPTKEARTLNLSIAGENAADFSADAQVTVAAGTSRSIPISFAPAASGVRAATLHYSAGTQSGEVVLRGFGTRPEISVSQALDFGAALGGESRWLRVANVGAAVPETDADDLRFARWAPVPGWLTAAPTIVGPDADQFALEWPPAGVNPDAGIAPGDAINLRIQLTPSSPGHKTATLVLFANDPVQPRLEIALTADAADDVPCELVVSPRALRFGTPLGAAETQTLQVRQLRPTACEVSRIALTPGSASSFKLGSRGALAIGGDRMVEVPVTFRPTVDGATHATIAVVSGDQTAVVDLYGTPNTALLVAPNLLDFGDAQCPVLERTATMTNNSSAPVQLDTLELSGSPDYALTQRPVLPKSIAPGETLVWKVLYRPSDVGDDAATLSVRGPVHGASIELRGRKSSDQPLQTDVFPIDPLPKWDWLFVIDDSPSMADKQQALATNLAEFFRFEAAQEVDYRFAVTTTAVDAAHGGTGAGDGFANGRFLPLAGTGPRVITPTTPNKAQAFAQNVAVGASSASDGFLLRPMQLALSEPLLSTHNAGFLRDDAHLAVVLITDGVDHDPVQLAEFQNFLVGLKGTTRANLVSFNAILPTAAQPPAGCTYGESNAGLSTRVRELASRTGGIYDEICAPDWYKTLEKICRIWPEYRTRFLLSQQPDLSVQPEPISVFFDDVKLNPIDSFGNVAWHYNEFANAIDFEPLATPPAGSTVTITYKVACP